MPVHNRAGQRNRVVGIIPGYRRDERLYRSRGEPEKAMKTRFKIPGSMFNEWEALNY